jgi:hypothetical protein
MRNRLWSKGLMLAALFAVGSVAGLGWTHEGEHEHPAVKPVPRCLRPSPGVPTTR